MSHFSPQTTSYASESPSNTSLCWPDSTVRCVNVFITCAFWKGKLKFSWIEYKKQRCTSNRSGVTTKRIYFCGDWKVKRNYIFCGYSEMVERNVWFWKKVFLFSVKQLVEQECKLWNLLRRGPHRRGSIKICSEKVGFFWWKSVHLHKQKKPNSTKKSPKINSS